MKKAISILMVTMMMAALCLTGCGNSSQDETQKKAKSKVKVEKTQTPAGDSDSAETNQEQLTGKHHVTIEVADYGTIEVELDADVAPITVTNFVNLAKDKFYDGLTFHRIISGFMIQGGDPKGDGSGGSDNPIKGEFSENGVENKLSHKRGVISMARTANDMNSASSQFFIVHQDSVFLDGQYAAFGIVTAGMEIVDKICQDVVPVDDNGTVPTEKQPKITAITVAD